MRRRYYRYNTMEKLFLNDRTFLLIVAFVAVALVNLLLPVTLKKRTLFQEIRMVEQNIMDLRARKTYLEHSVDMLQNDSEHIERLARDTLGFMRAEEVVYHIVNE